MIKHQNEKDSLKIFILIYFVIIVHVSIRQDRNTERQTEKERYRDRQRQRQIQIDRDIETMIKRVSAERRKRYRDIQRLYTDKERDKKMYTDIYRNIHIEIVRDRYIYMYIIHI